MSTLVTDVIGKLEKLKNSQLAAELSWCWVSYQNDQVSTGVVEKASDALLFFKEARERNAKAVAKKLVDDLEKAIA
jgi:hypothetical protein